MGYERIKTEHAGAKNGGGAWMTRAEAKQSARRKRRRIDKQDTIDGLLDERPPRRASKVAVNTINQPQKEPWTDSDPQPGDFDAELDLARPNQIEIHDGNPDNA